MPLEREHAAFRRELPQLLSQRVFAHEPPPAALVHGDAVHSVWDTVLDAARAGVLLFGENNFLVRRIVPEGTMVYGNGRGHRL